MFAIIEMTHSRWNFRCEYGIKIKIEAEFINAWENVQIFFSNIILADT